MELDHPGLENEWVRLNLLSADHRQTVYDSGAIDAMWTWMPMISSGTNFDSYFDHVQLQLKRGTMFPFMISDPETDEFLGVVSFLAPNRTHRRLEITHIWLVPEARGKGTFLAVQLLMIQRALDWGARRIVWLADERNAPAIAAYRKLGAHEEGLAREYQRMTDGHWASMMVFSMLRPEAKDAILHLEAKLAERAVAD